MIALPAEVEGKASSPKCSYSGKSGGTPRKAGQFVILLL